MILALVSVLFSGAIFGFFYAWVCSTMWGLDAADPQVAIAAMQAMNASVRNFVFAPVFFGTPVVLAVTALVLRNRSVAAALAFLMAGVIYAIGGIGVTLMVNVPMNEALALVDPAVNSARVWADYSGPWQVWNQLRTAVSGATLLLAGWGCWRLGIDQMATRR